MSTDERVVFGILKQAVIEYKWIISLYKYHNLYSLNRSPNLYNRLYSLGSSCLSNWMLDAGYVWLRMYL